MKKVCLVLVCVICFTLWGYGQSAFGDKVAILKIEDADGVLDRSGEAMLQSAMTEAFSRLQNVLDCSGFAPSQGSTFSPSEIKKIGERVFADMVIVPSVVKINEYEVFLSAKMVNVRTGVLELGGNVKCNFRENGKENQATVFKRVCEDLANNMSQRLFNQIFNNQMAQITFYKGKLYKDGKVLSEKEIKYFLADDGYKKWKQVEDRLIRGQRWMIAGSVLTSLGVSMTAIGIYGLIATEGWADDDPYRAMSIAGVIVGPMTIGFGLASYCCSKSKKAGWQEMEDIFLERQSRGYRAELNFGNQRYGFGFALKF